MSHQALLRAGRSHCGRVDHPRGGTAAYPAAGNRHVYSNPAWRLGDPGHAAYSRAKAGRQEGRIASSHKNSPRSVDHADDDARSRRAVAENAYLAAQEEQSWRRPNQPGPPISH